MVYFSLVCLLKLILYNSKPQNQMCDWNQKCFCFVLKKNLFYMNPHIWLWGFFTFLVDLAHGAARQRLCSKRAAIAAASPPLPPQRCCCATCLPPLPRRWLALTLSLCIQYSRVWKRCHAFCSSTSNERLVLHLHQASILHSIIEYLTI